MEFMRFHAPQTVTWEAVDDGEKFGDPAIDGLKMTPPKEGDLIQLTYVVRGEKGVWLSVSHIPIPPPGNLPGE